MTSIWGDMTMLPTCLASMGATGAEAVVCSGEKLREDKGSEALDAAEARAGKRPCVGGAGALGFRSIVDVAERNEDAMGSVNPEASSRRLQRSGKGARLACCEVGL